VAVLNKGSLLAVGPARALERQYSDERYRVRTRDADHRVWRELEGRGVIERVTVSGIDVDGWTSVECHVPGGADEAAQVLATLATAGVSVAWVRSTRAVAGRSHRANRADEGARCTGCVVRSRSSGRTS
jgi:hypothetical protein